MNSTHSRVFLQVQEEVLGVGLRFRASSRRSFCILLLKLVQEPDKPYNELHNMFTSPPYRLERQHLERFELGMRNFENEGIEYILNLCDNEVIGLKLLSKTGSQIGIIGFFLRRVNVTASRMSFTEMLILLKNVRKYYRHGEFVVL